MEGDIVEGDLAIVAGFDVLHIQDGFVRLVVGMRVHGGC
jgi:hypothetical protein